MDRIHVEMHEDVALVRLTNGVTNAINADMVEDLNEAMARIRTEARGMVMAGNLKIFSLGLDLPHLLKMDRTDFFDFFTNWNRCLLDLYTLPMPTAAAVAGHAVAGGIITALACDYRIVAAGKTKVGLNESRIGLPIPYLTDLMLRQVVGDRAATDMTYTGRFLDPEEARAIGLADEVRPPEEVETVALARISELAALAPPALAVDKAMRTRTVRALYEEHGRQFNDAFVDIWMAPEVRPLLYQAAEKF